MFILFLVTIVASFLTGLLSPTQKARRGNLKDFTFPQIGDGDPIAYLAGTVKITGPGLTWYGDYSTKSIKKSTGLFSSTTVGYKYYLGWMLVFCIGPNVTLRRLWFGVNSDPKLAGDGTTDTVEQAAEENNPNFTDPNDPKVPTPIYTGSFSTGTMHLADANAFGGDQGGGGYDLQIEFFGGEVSQGASAYLRSKINGFVPPYRGVCYLTAHGYIGNSTQLQNMTAELQRIPDPLNLGDKALVGSEGDVNPANVIYDMMTNNFGAGSCPVSRMNSQSFISGGLTLFDEDEGISIASGGSAQAMSAVVQDILRQIDATMYEDPETGLITLKLLREDYSIPDLLVIDDSNIIGVSNYAINLWSDTKNRVRLKYEDRQKDYDDRIAVGEDMANVSFQGGQVKAIAVEHPYIKRKDHANRKTASELAIYSTPLAKVSATVQRISTTLRPGSVIKASYGKYKINQLILRVTKISYGDLINNHLTLELVGDKFAKTTSIFSAPVTYFSKPNTGAISIQNYVLDETPRFFIGLQSTIVNREAPRVMVYPFAPNDNQTGYNLWTKAAGEADFVETLEDADFANFFQILNPMIVTGEADIELQALTSADALVTSTVDQIQRLGSGLLQIDDEIIAYESFSLDNSTNRYTLHGVHRGLLDTVPAAHAARGLLAVLSPTAVGQREFAATDTVDVRMGSIAATRPQDQDEATGAILVLQNRPMLPFPPVLVTLDGTAFPTTVDNSAGVTVAWKRRNRLNDQIVFETAADEAPEGGTEYFVRYGAGGLFKDVSLGTGTTGTFTFDLQGQNDAEFYSKLNGLESIQRVKLSTSVLHAAGVNVSVDLASADGTASYVMASVTITFGVTLQTAFASALVATAIVPVDEDIDVNLSTSVSTGPTASATISDGSVGGGGGGMQPGLEMGPSYAPSYSNGSGDRRSYIRIGGTITQHDDIRVYIDGNRNSSTFPNGGQGAGGYYDFNFFEPTTVTEFQLFDDRGVNQGTFKWQASNDGGQTFIDISSQWQMVGNSPDNSLRNNTSTYSYYRALQTAGTSSSAPYVFEMQFKIGYLRSNFAIHHPQGRGDRRSVIVVHHSSNDDMSGLVDGNNAGGNGGPYLSNGRTDDYIDFTFQNARWIDRIVFLKTVGAIGLWKWQGTNDGVIFDDLCDAIDMTNEINEFLLTHAQPYTTFRMAQTGGTTSAGPYLNQVLFSINAPVVLLDDGNGGALDDGNGNSMEVGR